MLFGRIKLGFTDDKLFNLFGRVLNVAVGNSWRTREVFIVFFVLVVSTNPLHGWLDQIQVIRRKWPAQCYQPKSLADSEFPPHPPSPP